MFKTIILSTTVAAAAIVVLPAQAATNLVANGGFETITTSSASGNFQIDNGGTVANWTSAGGYNLLFHAANANIVAGNAKGTWSDGVTGGEYMRASTASPVAAGGGDFVALDGDATVGAAGGLQQTISGLTVGAVYNLSFYFAGGQLASRSGGPLTEKLIVNFGNSSYTTPTLSYAAGGFTGWNQATTNFTATSTSQVLSFLSSGTPGGQPPVALLDGVSLTAAVPEASTWSMMIIGFGAVGCAVRRSRTKLAFA